MVQEPDQEGLGHLRTTIKLHEKFAPAARLHIEARRLEVVISRALFRLDAGLLVAAGQGQTIVAATRACPVLRLATPLPQPASASQPHYAGAFRQRGPDPSRSEINTREERLVALGR
jgi:hypothetical protein